MITIACFACSGKPEAPAAPPLQESDRHFTLSEVTWPQPRVAQDPFGCPQWRIVHSFFPVRQVNGKVERMQGAIVLSLTISKREGTVLAAEVVSASDEIIREPTLEAVRQWRFEPLDPGAIPGDSGCARLAISYNVP